MFSVLVFVARLVGPPEPRRARVEPPRDGSAFRCRLFGQMAIARWRREHPGFVLGGGRSL
ncbi:MAG: hypothetical protein RMK73_09460 [Geminicoccaceae bacterium]|nr:hypothetical protein [Geminicoccaceae bacterium]MDW8341695.1 hypothetical protein [Geminicoccaceae bacterium]